MDERASLTPLSYYRNWWQKRHIENAATVAVPLTASVLFGRLFLVWLVCKNWGKNTLPLVLLYLGSTGDLAPKRRHSSTLCSTKWTSLPSCEVKEKPIAKITYSHWSPTERWPITQLHTTPKHDVSWSLITYHCIFFCQATPSMMKEQHQCGPTNALLPKQRRMRMRPIFASVHAVRTCITSMI